MPFNCCELVEQSGHDSIVPFVHTCRNPPILEECLLSPFRSHDGIFGMDDALTCERVSDLDPASATMLDIWWSAVEPHIFGGKMHTA